MRHIHEPKPHRRLVARLAFDGVRPAHGFEQRKTKRGSEASEAGATIDEMGGRHGKVEIRFKDKTRQMEGSLHSESSASDSPPQSGGMQ